MQTSCTLLEEEPWQAPNSCDIIISMSVLRPSNYSFSLIAFECLFVDDDMFSAVCLYFAFRQVSEEQPFKNIHFLNIPRTSQPQNYVRLLEFSARIISYIYTSILFDVRSTFETDVRKDKQKCSFLYSYKSSKQQQKHQPININGPIQFYFWIPNKLSCRECFVLIFLHLSVERWFVSRLARQCIRRVAVHSVV